MKPTFVRVSGLMAILGGIVLLVIFYVGQATDLDQTILWMISPLMPVALALGGVGLYLSSAASNEVRAGLIVTIGGTVLAAIGFGLMAWFDSEAGWGVMFLGFLAMTLGMLLFGLFNRRARVLSRWNNLPLIIGAGASLTLLVGLGGEWFGLFADGEPAFAVWLSLMGGGWILLGIVLLLGGRWTAVPTAAGALFLLVMLLVLSGCSGTAVAEEARVSFKEPADGATVSSPVRVVMAADRFTIEPAGEVRDGAGHLHIMIDVDCLADGEVIPKDDNHRHFGDGSTEADLELAPGTHTLCLQAADGAHRALPGASLRQKVTITVK